MAAAPVGPARAGPGGRGRRPGRARVWMSPGTAPPEPRVAVRPHPRSRGTGDARAPGAETAARLRAESRLPPHRGPGGWGGLRNLVLAPPQVAARRAVSPRVSLAVVTPTPGSERSLRFHRPEYGSRCLHSGLTLRPLSAQLLFRNGRTSPTILTFKIHAKEFETWEENEVWSQGVCVLAASEEGRATLTSPLTSLSLDFEPPAQS